MRGSRSFAHLIVGDTGQSFAQLMIIGFVSILSIMSVLSISSFVSLNKFLGEEYDYFLYVMLICANTLYFPKVWILFFQFIQRNTQQKRKYYLLSTLILAGEEFL